jgi:O-succinylbenzoic acid--CoA ligase
VDGDGRVHVTGRMDDVVVTGGEKVWPAPVEAAVRALPAVADVAVTGRDDPEWGQRVVAFVVPADPAAPPSLDQVRDAVKAVLPAHAAPKELVLVAELPRTALGKVRRAALT